MTERNRSNDRKKGEKAEDDFKKLIEELTEFQVFLTQRNAESNKSYSIKDKISGDYYIAGDADVRLTRNDEIIVHCEIKIKYPTPNGFYGIELYRISDDLLAEKKSNIPIFYVIQNSKEKNSQFDPRDWIFA